MTSIRQLTVAVAVLLPSLAGCDRGCVNEDRYVGWDITLLSGQHSEDDYTGNSNGEVLVRLGDVEYIFWDAVPVAYGQVSADLPFSITLAYTPKGGPIDLYDYCRFQLDRAPISDIEIASQDDSGGDTSPGSVSFTLTLNAAEVRTLCQENLDELAGDPDSQRDETWDDWLETLELRDVNIRVAAEYYDYVERTSCGL